MLPGASTLPPPESCEADFAVCFDTVIGCIDGWLARDEAGLLYRAARGAQGGAIAEIGAYRGRSTAALVLGSRDGAGLPVYSVDPHAAWTGPGGGRYGPADREAFYRTVLHAGLAPWSVLVGLRSADAARAIDGPLSVLFIDGDHGVAAVMQDVRAWTPKLAADGLLLMDDVSDSFEGPRRAVERLMLEGWTQACPAVGKVVALRPPQVVARDGAVAPSTVGGVRQQRAPELVTAARLDLGAKHLYARLAGAEPPVQWGRRVYLAHLKVWNGFFEHVPRKRSAEDFLNAFDRVLADTAASTEAGLDTVIPVTLDGSPLNGAHRIAAALLHDRPLRAIPVEVVPDNARYDGAYFERLVADRGDGGEPRLLLAMCLEFLRIAPACRLMLLFGHTERHRPEVEAEIAALGQVVWSFMRRYDTPVAQRALVRLMYEGEAWLGRAADGFPGAAGKADPCFAAGPEVRFLLVLPNRPDCGPDDWATLKRRIRTLCQVDNHSVHVTDTVAEADRLLRTAADESAFELYAASRCRPMPRFDAQFDAFRALVMEQGRQADVVVTGSAVMALFGLRDSADIDYVHQGPALQAGGRHDIGSHNDYAGLFPSGLRDLVEDPGLHLVVDGVRFLRPEVLAAFKRARGEAKDAADLVLLGRLSVARPQSVPAESRRPRLWLVDGGRGHAHQVARLLGLRRDLPALLDVEVMVPPADESGSEVQTWADTLVATPGLRVLVVRDGLPEHHMLHRLGEQLPKEKLLLMNWQSIDGWREAFLAGLSAFAGLPQDADWSAAAQRQWDIMAEHTG